MPPSAYRKPPPPPQSIQDAEADFAIRARRIAADIRAEAAGRICGNCVHSLLSESGRGNCTAQINLNGNALHITRRDAVACKKGYAEIP